MAKCGTCKRFVESVGMQYLRARGPAAPGSPARLAVGRSCLCTLRLASGYRLHPVNCCASHPRLSNM
jgi:hypothetical protein